MSDSLFGLSPSHFPTRDLLERYTTVYFIDT